LRFSQHHGSRALFGILINSPDVRSHDAEADQINAAEENNRQDNWGISGAPEFFQSAETTRGLWKKRQISRAQPSPPKAAH
jgi:hypothetical protein